ncbi:MAG: ParB N-terminal domain-containing protein [Clostridia bacterium]|nr:ParB N-terminal domain-containing protein [Clostridia bacterium]
MAEVGKININELVSPEWNPREISDDEMEKLKTSLKEFGYVDYLVVNKVNNHIVGGNQRYHALKEMGFEELDVIFIEESDLNREKTLNIALNKISGDWDNERLEELLNELNTADIELILTGFDEFELEGLLFDTDEDLDDEVVDRSIEEAFNNIYEGLSENEELNDAKSDNRIISFYTADEDLYYKFLNYLGLNSIKLDKKRNVRLEDLECLKEPVMD